MSAGWKKLPPPTREVIDDVKDIIYAYGSDDETNEAMIRMFKELTDNNGIFHLDTYELEAISAKGLKSNFKNQAGFNIPNDEMPHMQIATDALEILRKALESTEDGKPEDAACLITDDESIVILTTGNNLKSLGIEIENIATEALFKPQAPSEIYSLFFPAKPSGKATG